jgi:hypothetical protein
MRQRRLNGLSASVGLSQKLSSWQGNKIPVYKSFAEIAVMIREERGDARNWMKAGLAPISISNGLLLARGLCGY